MKHLNRLPPELTRLTSLQSLDLSSCGDLSGDLSPLSSLTSLQSLNLYRCKQLSGDLSPLAGLTSLQSLNFTLCRQLSGDMTPLASLTSLQSLDLAECEQLARNLSPLAGLTSLQKLDLSGCIEIRKFTPLMPLLPKLHELYLYNCRFDALPSEICGQAPGQNIIREVRAHFADLRSGQSLDAERGKQLRRVDPHVVSLGAGLFTYVRGLRIALFFADRLGEKRKAVGATLVLVGLVTTIPAVWAIFGKSE